MNHWQDTADLPSDLFKSVFYHKKHAFPSWQEPKAVSHNTFILTQPDLFLEELKKDYNSWKGETISVTRHLVKWSSSVVCQKAHLYSIYFQTLQARVTL